ncbi:YtpR family tRNA-binding protein [Carnobacterium jeotgali]|uniref:YtpR family tRNA-binding protein n=1 Tax=Carnobacterium jeotgali TaxID=545534 RepID=UPI00388D2613
MISIYNNEGIGDTLIIMLDNSESKEQNFEKQNDVVRIFKEETNQTVGYNFFNSSTLIDLKGTGQVVLTNEQIKILNESITSAGFSDTLLTDESPKFVIGEVKECKPHPDSDHLSITQTEIDNGEIIQIVCGASNIAKGQKVVVAKVGAMMPNGMAIWDGELRGEPSHGMICSAQELNLKNASEEKGILVLPDSATTGENFQVN